SPARRSCPVGLRRRPERTPALGQGLGEQSRQRRLLLEELGEGGPVELEEQGVLGGHHRRRPRLAGEERHLSEVLPRSEPRHLHAPAGEDRHRPGGHHVEGLPRVALAENPLPPPEPAGHHLLPPPPPLPRAAPPPPSRPSRPGPGTPPPASSLNRTCTIRCA